MNEVTLEQAKEEIRTKLDLYQGLRDIGLCVPQFKSSIVTREFLIDMREMKIWIPKNTDLKIRHMRWEVTKQKLFEEIQRECQR